MCFKRRVLKEPYGALTSGIKKDLLLIFKQKGIDVTRLNIEAENNMINIKVCLDRNSVPDAVSKKPAAGTLL
jgi:hypothetical protein